MLLFGFNGPHRHQVVNLDGSVFSFVLLLHFAESLRHHQGWISSLKSKSSSHYLHLLIWDIWIEVGELKVTKTIPWSLVISNCLCFFEHAFYQCWHVYWGLPVYLVKSDIFILNQVHIFTIPVFFQNKKLF